MKFIQIATAQNGQDDHFLYGLSIDGQVYELRYDRDLKQQYWKPLSIMDEAQLKEMKAKQEAI